MIFILQSYNAKSCKTSIFTAISAKSARCLKSRHDLSSPPRKPILSIIPANV